MENLNPKLEKEIFVFPDVKKEMGEIMRAAEKYSPADPKKFALEFYEKSKVSSLIDLSEDLWIKLENTDSFDIQKNDWEKIEEHIHYTNNETGAQRDWQKFKNFFESNYQVDAPIILKYQGILHKVSGNTRLMVARALGKTPKVLLVDMDS
jgi:G3E family GTPase